MRFEGMYAHSK